MHHGPLWQFYLATIFGVLAAYRAAAIVFGMQSDLHTGIVAGMALQVLFAGWTAIEIWRGRRWALGALAALAVIAVATDLFAAVALGSSSITIVLGRIAITLVLTGAVAFLLNFEFKKGETNRERAARAAHDPSPDRESLSPPPAGPSDRDRQRCSR